MTQFGLDSLRLDLWMESDELTRDPGPKFERFESDPRLASPEEQEALREAFDVAQAFHGHRADLNSPFRGMFGPRPR